MSGYTDWQQQVTILAQAASADESYDLSTNPDFQNSLPFFISYAEQRIYKKLVFLAARTNEESSTFTAGNQFLPLALLQNKIIVVEGLAAVTPVGQTTTNGGTRWEFEPVSLDFVDIAWPTSSVTSAPDDVSTGERVWSMYDDQTIKFGPAMDQAYTASVTGIFQPTPLSSTNPDTYLTLNWMPQFIAASMIYITGWQRDFGAQSDNPQMAQSWESQYQKLEDVMMLEEQRRRGSSTGWSAQTPTIGVPPRT